MHNDVKKILVSEEEIIQRCKELGPEISEYYRQDPEHKLLVVGLLKGSVPFLAELIKRMDADIIVDFMDVSSYSGTHSTEVKIIKDIESTATDKNVLIVEDIVDTGKTLLKVVDIFKQKGANTVKIVTLLNKPGGRCVDIEADWTGFVIPDEFVIGFGLDYDQKYRNLPYVGVIKEEAI